MQNYFKTSAKIIAFLFSLFAVTNAFCQTSASTMGFSTSNANDNACDVFGLGITDGGGLGAPYISYDLLPNYHSATSIGAIATYEHFFTDKFGLGAAFSYSSASNNATITYPAGVAYPAGTLTDTKNGAYMGLGGRCVYHPFGRHKLEPYIGAIAGITITDLYSDTHTIGSPSAFTNSYVYAGLLIGALAGLEYHINPYFSVRLEANYSGVPNYLGGFTITYRIINRF